MQQIFAISGLVNFLVSIFISFFIFVKKRTYSNIIFSILTFSTAVWSFGYWIWLSEYENYEQAIFWLRVLTVGSIWIPILFTHWISLIFNEGFTNNIKKKVIITSYILGLVFSILAIFSDLLVESVSYKMGFIFWPNAGPLYIFYIIFVYFALVFYTGILLLKYYRKSYGSLKNKIKYVSIGCIIALIGGFFNFFLWYDIPIPPYGNLIIPIYPILISYAIVKFRLMDIKLALTRSILYGVLVATVAAFFALSVLVVGQAIGGNTQTSKILTYIFTSFIVVVFLDPVKRIWARITDKIFYKDKIDYQALLQQVGAVVSREINLHLLLQKVCQLLAKDLKIKQVDIFVPQDGKYELLTSSNEKQRQFFLASSFVQYLKINDDILIVEELLRRQSEYDSASEEYNQIDNFLKEAEIIQAEMVVPVVEAGQLTAIFVFNNKYSGDLYDQNDINFFKVLIPQIATAIEKSKLYEKVQEFNIELQQKVEERTRTLKEVNLTLEDRNRFLTAMQSITSMVTRTLDLKQVNQMIVDAIASQLGYVGGILSFVTKDKKSLKVGAITNNALSKEAISILGQDPRDYESPLVENFNFGVQAVLYKKIIFSERLSDFLSPPVDKKTIDQIQKKLGIETAVAVPIFSEGQIIGVINFLSPLKQEKISSIDMEIMNALSNQVGIVSRNLQLYNNLQKANRELQDANMRLRELDKTKSEFLSIASHQLRTPISAIKGYLSMMIDGDYGKMPDSISEVLKNLLESSARLARLINVFLNVSRIESGRLKLDKKPTQINEVIDSVIVELINQAEQKGLKLVYKKPKKIPPLILADGDKLREVVLNLIDNSIKYTPEGKIDIFVEHSDKELTFTVKDTGIGIDKDEIKSFFRKFVRGSGVAQIHTGGSGLGLFIAQKIVKEHGGNIWAESPGKGKGSSFIFTVPLYDESEALEQEKEKSK